MDGKQTRQDFPTTHLHETQSDNKAKLDKADRQLVELNIATVELNRIYNLFDLFRVICIIYILVCTIYWLAF